MWTQALRRRLVVDANDGIIATAGVVEGFAGAGAGDRTVLLAALAAMVAGGLSLGAAKYSEAVVERDAELALVEEERRQLALSPAEELRELAAHYEDKGLSPTLAAQVASELSAHDALTAHVEAEHGLSGAAPATRPWREGAISFGAFAAGAVVPLAAMTLAPHELRISITLVAVLASLAATAVVVTRSGVGRPVRTVARSVLIGLVIMLVSLAGGTLFASV